MCRRRAFRESKRRQRQNDPTYELYHSARQRATKKGIPFTISLADIRAVWPADGKCPVLGIELSHGPNGRVHDASPTLDRLNNAWGYEPANICVISHRANSAKRTLTAGELEKIVAWMRSKGLD